MNNQEGKISYRRYVAFFDMLGMKSAVCRNQFKAWDALCSLEEAREKIYKYAFELTELNKKIVLRERVKFTIFSDSIIAFTYKDEIDDLWAILFFSIELFSQCLRKCVPVRGGISFGDFLFNEERSFFVGKPLIEAHAISESAQWIGIVLSDYVASQCRANNIRGGDKEPIVAECDLEQKDGSIQRKSVINWLATHKNNFEVTPPISVEQFYKAFESLFGEYSELKPEVQKKYNNTVKFINNHL